MRIWALSCRISQMEPEGAVNAAAIAARRSTETPALRWAPTSASWQIAAWTNPEPPLLDEGPQGFGDQLRVPVRLLGGGLPRRQPFGKRAFSDVPADGLAKCVQPSQPPLRQGALVEPVRRCPIHGPVHGFIRRSPPMAGRLRQTFYEPSPMPASPSWIRLFSNRDGRNATTRRGDGARGPDRQAGGGAPGRSRAAQDSSYDPPRSCGSGPPWGASISPARAPSIDMVSMHALRRSGSRIRPTAPRKAWSTVSP